MERQLGEWKEEVPFPPCASVSPSVKRGAWHQTPRVDVRIKAITRWCSRHPPATCAGAQRRCLPALSLSHFLSWFNKGHTFHPHQLKYFLGYLLVFSWNEKTGHCYYFFLITTVMHVHQIKTWKLWESAKKEIKIAHNFTPQICDCWRLGVSPQGCWDTSYSENSKV